MKRKSKRPKEPYCQGCTARKARGGCWKCTHPPPFKGITFTPVAFMGDL